MKYSFEELPRDMQETIVRINVDLNRTAFKPNTEVVRVRIAKMFTHDDGLPSSPVPHYEALFRMARRIGTERGRFVFEHLLDQ